MIFTKIKTLFFIFVYLIFFISFSKSEIVKEIVVLGNERITWKDNFTPYLGKTYNIEEINSTLENFKDKLEIEDASDESVVDKLANGKIVAVF